MVEKMTQDVTIPVTNKEGTMYQTYREYLEYSGAVNPYSLLPGLASLLDQPIVVNGSAVPEGLVPLFAVSELETLYVTKELYKTALGVKYNSKSAQKGRKYARSMMTATHAYVSKRSGKIVLMENLRPEYKAIFDGIHYGSSVATMDAGPQSEGMQVRREIYHDSYYKGAMGPLAVWVPPHVDLVASERKADLQPTMLSPDVALMVQPTVGVMKTELGVALGVQSIGALFGQVLNDAEFQNLLDEMVQWNLDHWDQYRDEALKGTSADVLEATEVTEGTTFKSEITNMLKSIGVHPGAIPAAVTGLVNNVSEDMSQAKLRINAITNDGPMGFTSYPRALVWRMLLDVWESEEKLGSFKDESEHMAARRLRIMKELKVRTEIEVRFNEKSEEILDKTGFAAIAMTEAFAKHLGIPALDINSVNVENAKELAEKHGDNLGAGARWPTSAKVDVRILYVTLPEQMFAHETVYFGSTVKMQKAVLVSMDGGDADDKAFFFCGKLGRLALRSMTIRNEKLGKYQQSQIESVYKMSHDFLRSFPDKLDMVNNVPNAHKVFSSYFDLVVEENVQPSGLIVNRIIKMTEKQQPADPSIEGKSEAEKWDLIHLPGANEFMPLVGAMANAQMFGSYLLGGLITMPESFTMNPEMIAAALMEGEISLVVDAAQSGSDFEGAWRAWHNIDAVLTTIALSWVANDNKIMRATPQRKLRPMTVFRPVRKRLGVSLMALVTAPVAIKYTGEVSEITGQKITAPAIWINENQWATAKSAYQYKVSRLTAEGKVEKIEHPILQSFRRYWAGMATNLLTFIEEANNSQTATILTVSLQAFLEEHSHELDALVHKYYLEDQNQLGYELDLTHFGNFMFHCYHSARVYQQENGSLMTVKDAMTYRYAEIEKIKYMVSPEELKTLRRVYAQKPIHQAFTARHQDLWPKFVEVYGDKASYKYEIYLLSELTAALGNSAESEIKISMGGFPFKLYTAEDGTKSVDDLAIDAQQEMSSSGGYSRKMLFMSNGNYKGYAEVLCKFLKDEAVKRTAARLATSDVTAAFLIRESKNNNPVDPESLVGLTIEQLLSDSRIQLAYGGSRGHSEQDSRAAAIAYFVFRKSSDRRHELEASFKGKTQWEIAGMMGYQGTLTNFFSGETTKASAIERREGHGANGKPYTRSFVWLTFKGETPVTPEPTPEVEFFENPVSDNFDFDSITEGLNFSPSDFEDAFGHQSEMSAEDLERYVDESDLQEEAEVEYYIPQDLVRLVMVDGKYQPADMNDVKWVKVEAVPEQSTTLGLANRIADKAKVESKLGLPEGGASFSGEIQTPAGNLIAKGYLRIVYGDHGPYIEFAPSQVRLEGWDIRRKGDNAWYDEARLDGVMLYLQKKTVATLPNPPAGPNSVRNNRPEGYADYKPGMIYVDPWKVKIVASASAAKPAPVPPPLPAPKPAEKPIYRIAFTGHRPEKIGGYDENNPMRLAVKKAIEDALKRAIAKYGQTHEIIVVAGGAMGVDTDAARAAYNLKLKYIVARPCSDHGDFWTDQTAKTRYKKMLELAHKVVLVNNQPYDKAGKAECLHARNRWMVDNCDAVVAIWDGSPSGTSNCVAYARKVKRPMIIINPKDLMGNK